MLTFVPVLLCFVFCAVDKTEVTYRTLWNAFKRVAIALKLSDTEMHQVFGQTAVRVYGLELTLTATGPESKY